MNKCDNQLGGFWPKNKCCLLVATCKPLQIPEQDQLEVAISLNLDQPILPVILNMLRIRSLQNLRL